MPLSAETTLDEVMPYTGILAKEIQISESEKNYVMHYERNKWTFLKTQEYLERVYAGIKELEEETAKSDKSNHTVKTLKPVFKPIGEFDYETAKKCLETLNFNQAQILAQCCTWYENAPEVLVNWTKEKLQNGVPLKFEIRQITVAIPEGDNKLKQENDRTIAKALHTLIENGNIFSFQMETVATKTCEIKPSESGIWNLPTDEATYRRTLDERRKEIAQTEFEAHLEENKEEVEETDGWSWVENHYFRTYYVRDPENPEGSTRRETFGIEFQPNSEKLEHL